MKYTDIPFFFVFDVESVGLHGEAFAVGYSVVDPHGNEHDAALLHIPYPMAKGTLGSFDWVRANVPGFGLSSTISMIDMRNEFWEAWLRWKERYACMAADVNWPVESNFLSACVNLDHHRREWAGPYPLIDIASVILANGYDPMKSYPRLENELPEHNPLADARQSARLLTMAFRNEALTFVP